MKKVSQLKKGMKGSKKPIIKVTKATWHNETEGILSTSQAPVVAINVFTSCEREERKWTNKTTDNCTKMTVRNNVRQRTIDDNSNDNYDYDNDGDVNDDDLTVTLKIVLFSVRS